MALTPFDFFSRIIATQATDSGGFHTLTVEYRRAGMGAPPAGSARLIDQSVVHSFPGSIQTPFPIVLVQTLVMGKLPRQVLPLTPGFGDIQHRIHRFSHVNFNRSSGSAVSYRQQIPNDRPLCIAQITGITFPSVTHLARSYSVVNGSARTSILPNRNSQMVSKKIPGCKPGYPLNTFESQAARSQIMRRLYSDRHLLFA